MSYIFDALKKSQAARGRSETAEDPLRPQLFSNRTILHRGPSQEAPIKSSVAAKWFRLIAIALTVNGAITVYHHVSDPRHETQSEQMAAREGLNIGNTGASTTIPSADDRGVANTPKSAGPAQEHVSVQAHRNDLTKSVSLSTPTKPEPSTKLAVVSSSEREIPFLWQKSAGFQQNIPAMSIDMLIFSEKPNQRFAFVNMRKVREGELIAKGIILEEIKPNELLFSFRNEKFRLAARR